MIADIITRDELARSSTNDRGWRRCLGNNGPDQGQTLAAADRWRTDGTERELAMLIEVRGGASWRFSAPQSPIGCSLSSPPLLCSSAPAPPPPPGRTQQAVRLGLLCGGFAGFAGVFPLTSQHCVVASALDEGKGEGRVAPSSRSPAAPWATPSAGSAPQPHAAGRSIRLFRGPTACYCLARLTVSLSVLYV